MFTFLDFPVLFIKYRSPQRLILTQQCYALSTKSHYEVLNLKRDCSTKDIREAFAKLSKMVKNLYDLLFIELTPIFFQ